MQLRDDSPSVNRSAFLSFRKQNPPQMLSPEIKKQASNKKGIYDSPEEVFSSKGHMSVRKNKREDSREGSSNRVHYDEYQVIEIKMKLDEEMVKNENLERKIRDMEFDFLKAQNEANRRIQELEMKNNNLDQQVQELENLLLQKSNDDQNVNTMNQDLENQLNEARVTLLERETQFINQINKLRSENFDLKLKSQKLNLLTTRNNKPNIPRNTSKNSLASPSPQKLRMHRFSQLVINSNEMRNTSSGIVDNLQLLTTDETLQNEKLDNEIKHELKLSIHEVDLEDDKKSIQIPYDEIQQIQPHEFLSTDKVSSTKFSNHSKRPSFFQFFEKQREESDNIQIVKLERRIKELQDELILSEDKYTKLHQKYLEDRRQQDQDIAYLNDKYTQDIQYYQHKVDKQKEKERFVQEENENLKIKLMQNQDLRQEIITDLEEQEQRLRDAENEKHQLEKDFLYQLETKNQIIKEKSERIQELQDTIFNFDITQKELLASVKSDYQKKINKVKDLLSEKENEFVQLEIEMINFRQEMEKQQQLNKEIGMKRDVLSELVKEINEQKKEMELSYIEKIEYLEMQMDHNARLFQQQLSSLKTEYEVLGEEGQQLQTLKEVDEEFVDSDHQSSENNLNNNFKTENFKTDSTANTGCLSFTKRNFESEKKARVPLLAIQTTLMDELDDQQRFSVASSTNFYLREQQNRQPHRIIPGGITTPMNHTPRGTYMMIGDTFRAISPTNYGGYGGSPYGPSRQSMRSSRHNSMALYTPHRMSQFKIDLKQNEIEIDNNGADTQALRDEIEQLKADLNEKDEEIEELEQQLEVCQEEIKALKKEKEDMQEDSTKQMISIQEQATKIFEDMQKLKKQKQDEQQQMHKELIKNSTMMTQELQQLRRKLRRVEQENEEMINSIISEKQQYSLEINHLKIQLTEADDKVIQSKLKEAQLVMEKDLINLKLQESRQQVDSLKEEIEQLNKDIKLLQTLSKPMKRGDKNPALKKESAFKMFEDKMNFGFEKSFRQVKEQMVVGGNLQKQSPVLYLQRKPRDTQYLRKYSLSQIELTICKRNQQNQSSGQQNQNKQINGIYQNQQQKMYSDSIPSKMISDQMQKNEEQKILEEELKQQKRAQKIQRQIEQSLNQQLGFEEEKISKVEEKQENDLLTQGDIKKQIKKEKEMKKLGKKLKQIEKLEGINRDLNEDEKAKIAAKDSLIQKMKELSLS